MPEDDLFQNAFQHAAIGMALVAPAGRWLRVNQSLCEIVGYSAEELSHMTFQDITHPEDLEKDMRQAEMVVRGEIRTYRMEKRYIRKGGGVVWVLLSVSLARNDDGSPRFFISQVKDINEQKLAEEDRDRLFALPNVLHYVAGFDGYFKRLSPSWEETLGFSTAELLATPYLEFIHPDDRAATIAHALAREKISNLGFRNRYRHCDGTYRWILWSSVCVVERELYYGVAHDYTARQELEDQLATSLGEKERMLKEIHSSAILVKTLQESLFSVCAWTRQVRCNGEWMSIEKFLQHYLQLQITHGISDEAAAQMVEEVKAIQISQGLPPPVP